MSSELKILFKVEFPTKYGQNLYVVGSLPVLGTWIERKGSLMKYKHPSTWELELNIPWTTDEVKYKYCILEDQEGIPYWEPGLDRIIQISKEAQDGKVERFDTWGDGKKVQQIQLEGKDYAGKLYRSPMPFAPMFDPTNSVYKEWEELGIDLIVCLAYRDECSKKVGFDLLSKYGRDGLPVIYFPIDDFKTPQNAGEFATLVIKIEGYLRKGCNVVIHCHAGIGRTGITICCLGKKFLFGSDKDAVAWIRNTIRGAVQTQEQVNFVNSFKI